MKRKGARAALVACVALWGATLWALNSGALAQELPIPLQTCVPDGPPPVGCPDESPSPSGSSSPSPSGSPSEEPEPTEEDSKITIKYSNNKFSGAVKADTAKCEKGRKVSVKKRGAGVVGTDTTDNAGKWSVRYPEPKGKRYFAKVAPKKVGETTCNGAKSQTIKAT